MYRAPSGDRLTRERQAYEQAERDGRHERGTDSGHIRERKDILQL